MRVADCDLNDLGFIGSRLNGVLVATIHRSNLLKSFRFFTKSPGGDSPPGTCARFRMRLTLCGRAQRSARWRSIGCGSGFRTPSNDAVVKPGRYTHEHVGEYRPEDQSGP